MIIEIIAIFNSGLHEVFSPTGEDVPKPIDGFEDCKLTEIISNNVNLAGYGRPTPVQKNALPFILANRDLMACAQTGSG